MKMELGKLTDPELVELMHDVAGEIEGRMMAAADRCVCCGRYVPEGRQTCPVCDLEFGRE